MPRDLRWKVPLIIIAIAAAAFFAFPFGTRINLGLDLQGGMHLVLRVDTEDLSIEERADATLRALQVLRTRIDDFGVREPVLQRQGAEHIVIQLPGVHDRQRALDLIGRTAVLEFKLVDEDPDLLAEAIEGPVPAGYELRDDGLGSQILLEATPVLTGALLKDAMVDFGSFNEPVVNFQMNGEGGKIFSRVTSSNIGRRLAIVLDGKVQSAPVIRGRIGDSGQITGQFTQQEATDLAIILRAGALPAPIIIEEERTVGPSLGADSIRAGMQATAVGAALVVLFMMGYYLVAGVVAVTALVMNVIFILGGLGYFGGTLTLPGIAGIVLTIGMALDANILIFERIREELSTGKALRSALRMGYAKAFGAILDSNVTTLIAAGLLFQFGTGPIKGFALTLTIGLLASMFTALVVTKVIFEVLIGTGMLKQLSMMQFLHATKIDFLRHRTLCFIASCVVLVVGLTSFFMQKEQAYGIDFVGGQLQEYRFESAAPVEALRSALHTQGIEDASIQLFGDPREILIRTTNDTVDAVAEVLPTLGIPYTQQRIEYVGPIVGEQLRDKAMWAIVSAILGILIYVGIRFKQWEFGVAGIVALFHDVLIALGFLALTHRELSLTLIAGLLTIAGYSINDTIVVYDRMRENMRHMRKASLREVINTSINQMLSRTLLTSMTTLMAVTALYVLGGQVLNDFAFCLLVGFVVGTYSSIYIAGALVVVWKGRLSTR
jgi:SecD/SecF fusion protein